MKIISRILWGGGLLLAGLALISNVKASDPTDPAPRWKVRVAGFKVGWPVTVDNQDSQEINWSPGVTVTVVVIAPKGKIIDVNQDESELKSFTDDKGDNLLTELDSSDFHRPNIHQVGFDRDNASFAVLEIDAPGRPTKGTTEFEIKGSLAVQTAGQTAEVSAENVALKPGTEFNLGKLKLTVSAVTLQEEGCEVTLKAAQDLSSISKLEFFDDQGNKMKAERGETSSFSNGNEVSVEWMYNLKNKLNKAKITATCWTDAKTVTVPFDVKAGLGL